MIKVKTKLKILLIARIILSIIFLLWIGLATLFILSAEPGRVPVEIKFEGILGTLFIGLYLINAFHLLALKDSARKIAITLDLFSIGIDMYILIPNIVKNMRFGDWQVGFYLFHFSILSIFCSFMHYFKNPRVQEIFTIKKERL